MEKLNLVNKFDVKPFLPEKMVRNPAIVIIAKRGSGKTWICRSLLNSMRNIPLGVIISHTERTDPFFSDFFPGTFIYDKYEPEIFQKIMARQLRIRKKAQEKALEGKKIDTRIFLLMDDCLSDNKSWANDKLMREILFNGRHLDITYILTMQEPMAINPGLRSNFDYVFLMYTDIFTEQKKFYEHYTGMFPTFSAFKQVYENLTEDFGAMVIKKREAKRDITDKIFHFRANNITPKMLGCRQMIKYHNKNFDKDWEEKMMQNQFNINDYVKRSDARNFVVEKMDRNNKPIYD